MDLGDRLATQSRWLHWLLVHLAGKRVRRAVELEDLIQEVYVRVLTRPDSVPEPDQGDEYFRRTLTKIARQVVIDVARALRAKKRDGVVVRLTRSDWSDVGARESAIADSAAGALTRLGGLEQLSALVRAFEELPSDQRKAIGFRQFMGLSAAETGERMGRSEAAIHSLYRRALEAWHERLSRRSGD